MVERRVVSVDIGSTWTKGALFVVAGEQARTAARAAVPTTTDDLSRGYAAVVRELTGGAAPGETPVLFCSSAKGGLSMAAVGLVPDLTLKAARLTAMSAGGKVVASYAYRLGADDIRALEGLNPDIILFTGGTDGGNDEGVLRNARALAGAKLDSVILYAGNQAIAGEVEAALAGRELVRAANVMPEVGEFRPEPAREAVRRIFLEKIVTGKGLDRIVAQTGHAPLPTPLAVFELVQAVTELEPGFGDFCAIDMGGATTDVYSSAADPEESDRLAVKGLREPRVKRSVEGDLGLRISAETLLEAAGPLFGEEAESLRSAASAFRADPSGLAVEPAQKAAEQKLACGALALGLLRHAGRMREVWTALGKAHILTGKDLRLVRTVIGTGGYLCRAGGALWETAQRMLPREDNGLVLAPERAQWAADREYLWPLLGNLAGAHRRAAARSALECLDGE